MGDRPGEGRGLEPTWGLDLRPVQTETERKGVEEDDLRLGLGRPYDEATSRRNKGRGSPQERRRSSQGTRDAGPGPPHRLEGEKGRGRALKSTEEEVLLSWRLAQTEGQHATLGVHSQNSTPVIFPEREGSKGLRCFPGGLGGSTVEGRAVGAHRQSLSPGLLLSTGESSGAIRGLAEGEIKPLGVEATSSQPRMVLPRTASLETPPVAFEASTLSKRQRMETSTLFADTNMGSSGQVMKHVHSAQALIIPHCQPLGLGNKGLEGEACRAQTGLTQALKREPGTEIWAEKELQGGAKEPSQSKFPNALLTPNFLATGMGQSSTTGKGMASQSQALPRKRPWIPACASPPCPNVALADSTTAIPTLVHPSIILSALAQTHQFVAPPSPPVTTSAIATGLSGPLVPGLGRSATVPFWSLPASSIGAVEPPRPKEPSLLDSVVTAAYVQTRLGELQGHMMLRQAMEWPSLGRTGSVKTEDEKNSLGAQARGLADCKGEAGFERSPVVKGQGPVHIEGSTKDETENTSRMIGREHVRLRGEGYEGGYEEQASYKASNVSLQPKVSLQLDLNACPTVDNQAEEDQ